MSTVERRPLFTDDQLEDMQVAIERALRGEADPEAMRRACERMDRTRKEIEDRAGIMDFAVPTIRALRDGEDG